MLHGQQNIKKKKKVFEVFNDMLGCGQWCKKWIRMEPVLFVLIMLKYYMLSKSAPSK